MIVCGYKASIARRRNPIRRLQHLRIRVRLEPAQLVRAPRHIEYFDSRIGADLRWIQERLGLCVDGRAMIHDVEAQRLGVDGFNVEAVQIQLVAFDAHIPAGLEPGGDKVVFWTRRVNRECYEPVCARPAGNVAAVDTGKGSARVCF